MEFKSELDKNIYQTYNCVKILFTEFEPIIGGTTALYLQNCLIRTPEDMDIYFIGISTEDFLQYVKDYDIEEPETPIKIDWQCFEYVNTNPINILFYDSIIRVQPVHEIIRFKSEYLTYSPGKDKYQKHLDDIKSFYDICNI